MFFFLSRLCAFFLTQLFQTFTFGQPVFFPSHLLTQPRPPDLVGSWALETAGWDGLSDFPAEKSEMEDLGMNDLVVAFRKDGTVQVPTEKGLGLQWRVEPGPTHLDTIYFEMIPSAPEVIKKASTRGTVAV